MTTRDDHRYAMWDAAYVLGSLSASDCREFEAHMANCPACREGVADLSGVPALLSQLDREEVAAINESGRVPLVTLEMSPARPCFHRHPTANKRVKRAESVLRTHPRFGLSPILMIVAGQAAGGWDSVRSLPLGGVVGSWWHG